MRRRHFIGLIGARAAWHLAAGGQQKARYPTIALVGSAATDDEETRRSIRAFESACSEFGWVEGRNIHVVYRWAESSQMRAVVAELVASAPDVIVANGTSVLTAVRAATNSNYGDSALNYLSLAIQRAAFFADFTGSASDGLGPRLPGLSARPVRRSMRARKRSVPSGRAI